MNTLPCRGCQGSWTPNCIESCISYDVWVKAHLRRIMENLLYIEKMEKLIPPVDIERSKELYYEPCDEAGDPYRKGDLDDKFKKFRDY